MHQWALLLMTLSESVWITFDRYWPAHLTRPAVLEMLRLCHLPSQSGLFQAQILMLYFLHMNVCWLATVLGSCSAFQQDCWNRHILKSTKVKQCLSFQLSVFIKILAFLCPYCFWKLCWFCIFIGNCSSIVCTIPVINESSWAGWETWEAAQMGGRYFWFCVH